MAVTLPVEVSLESASRTAALPRENALDADAVYQLVKRSEINPHEVEIVGAHVVEVSVLWKSAILHVAHIDGSRDFVLSSRVLRKAPAGTALLGGLAAGSSFLVAGAAMGNPVIGALGTVVALAGAGAGIALETRNHQRARDASQFIVDAEMLSGATEVPVVVRGDGATRFVFVSGASGQIELNGVKRSLAELIASGEARASIVAPGAHEIVIQSDSRYRMEIGGLTITARVVAPARRVVGSPRRDPARLWAGVGAASAIAALIGASLFATADDGYLSAVNEEDQLREIAGFLQRQQDRQPEQAPPESHEVAENVSSGTRHAGAEGAMGARTAPVRSAHYTVRRNNEPPHLAREQAREMLTTRGVFAALGSPGGATGGASGPVSPFGAITESGNDDESHTGNMTGAIGGDAFGWGGLGTVGTGNGGGGDGIGTVGTGRIGTLGHGDREGYGGTQGTHLVRRPNEGPTLRPGTLIAEGGLAPEAIRRVVLRNLGQVRHCHEQGLSQNPDLQGRVVVRFVVGGEGMVLASVVSESSVTVPSVSSCIASAVRRWQFPEVPGGGTASVTYPFILEPAAR